MHRNRDLYQFLVENSWQMSEDWYQKVDDQDPESIYSSHDPKIIQTLKEQNQDYFLHLHTLFIEEESHFFSEFKKWSEELARDQKHLTTPVHYVVREFNNTKDVYLSYIKKFYQENTDKISVDQLLHWIEIVGRVVNLSIYIYIDEAHKNTIKQLEAQKQMINELSSPIISLENNTALLPLIGDIDTARAKLILENTLTQCAERRIEQLCIDLSGVAIIDTMVAHEIFHLISALKLLGVKSILSGIRPEIAQTAIQLGLDFEDITTTSSLARALERINA
ncbi:STAS domain-containing protein [uncultured Metabacillus sp.]|uniref:STAS domain-containing protein n=1 Tax=uncultured Metabacillus sp. TaxID=2860135 RepID=UPI00260ED614|nr:STAS domain-containing protein [uncultured Metabacillus sp.]